MNEQNEMDRLTILEERTKSNAHRLDAVEKRQDNLDQLVNVVATMKAEQGYIKQDVTEIKTDVKALTEKPGRRWDGLVDRVLLVAVTAVLTFLAAKLGLG